MRCNYCGLLTFHNSVVLHYAYMQNRTSENQAVFRLRAHTHTYTEIQYIVNSMRTLKLYVLVEHFQNNGHEKAVGLLPVFLYGCHFVYGTLSS